MFCVDFNIVRTAEILVGLSEELLLRLQSSFHIQLIMLRHNVASLLLAGRPMELVVHHAGVAIAWRFGLRRGQNSRE